jgi:putative salt-induced outer membrane protein YdiY
MTLSVEAGPGYVWEELDGVGYNDYATIRFAENFEWKFAEKSRLFQSFEYLPQISDFGNYVLNSVVGIETDIAKGLALQVVFKDYYRSEPAAWVGTDPIIFREKNDYQLLAGIIYKFN